MPPLCSGENGDPEKCLLGSQSRKAAGPRCGPHLEPKAISRPRCLFAWPLLTANDLALVVFSRWFLYLCRGHR